MEQENFKIVEINGVKMQVDLRHAKVIDEYRVGDNVKVLVADYSDNFKSYIGTIIGFDDFQKTPTIVIAYLKTEYSAATIEFLYYNKASKNAEITALNDWDIPLKKSQIVDWFNKEVAKKEQEVIELKQKSDLFETLFGKYFEKISA